MRPSYDGGHPVAPTPTPIYDELYSEYRRLFRALPGDRTGEEDMRFTGFAVRDRPYGGGGGDDYRNGRDGYGAPAQQQPFAGYTGQLPGAPQFVPAQQAPQHATQQHATQQHPTQQHLPHQQHLAQHQYQASPYPQPQQQATGGQGWVAAGYLVPAAPGPVLPSPAVPGPAAPGRHRGNLLSLPPGRS
ncbi:hypothetical protein [Kitasatospora sp. NBC_01266]|uniref:hypothetical protein n=1 Tax=Kitasatospora sp. NBC_01266 TaxID=2903572 RepID=UPI002E314D36|nr:hypothetical protein [Kitasatospora sp. NBC_01266]